MEVIHQKTPQVAQWKPGTRIAVLGLPSGLTHTVRPGVVVDRGQRRDHPPGRNSDPATDVVIGSAREKCIAAGLMLCWPCDLIIAADNAQFSDPVGLMGMPGVEAFAHPWEFGPRRAKQILFT